MLPLTGCILAGGFSRRMGTEKAAMVYAGKPQWQRASDLLAPFCKEVFFSVRPGQLPEVPLKRIEDLSDYTNSGPMGGVLSVFATLPSHALLVVGCDYPYLTKHEINQLMLARTKGADAICFQSNDVTCPLPAIYEWSVLDRMKARHREGDFSLRHLLDESSIVRLQTLRPEALESVNTKEDYNTARLKLGR